MQILNNANFNFLRWKWHAIALSAVVILAGIAMIAVKGMPLGIDFSGGTLIVVQFDQPTTEAQVRDAVGPLPGEEVVQQYGDASERRLLIRLPQVEGAVEGNSLEQGSAAVEQALTKAGLPKFTIVNRELVSAVIGGDLQRHAQRGRGDPARLVQHRLEHGRAGLREQREHEAQERLGVLARLLHPPGGRG